MMLVRNSTPWIKQLLALLEQNKQSMNFCGGPWSFVEVLSLIRIMADQAAFLFVDGTV